MTVPSSSAYTRTSYPRGGKHEILGRGRKHLASEPIDGKLCQHRPIEHIPHVNVRSGQGDLAKAERTEWWYERTTSGMFESELSRDTSETEGL